MNFGISNFNLLRVNKSLNKIYLLIMLGFLLLTNNEMLAVNNLNSPRATLHTHLNNLQISNYQPHKAAKALFKGNKSNKTILDFSIKLKRILDAKKIFIELSQVPNNENFIDTSTNKNIYFLSSNEPTLYLEKINNKWLYSEETVNLVEEIYNQIYFFEIVNLTDKLPSIFHKNLFGITLWQYLGIILFLFFGLLIYRIIKKVLKYTFSNLLKKLKHLDVDVKHLNKIASPISFTMVLILLDHTFSLLFLPSNWLKSISFIISICYPILFIIFGWYIIDLISEIFQNITTKSKSKLDDQLIPFGRKLIKGVLVLLGTFYFVSSLGVDYTPLLAGASIGGLALALAAQETVRNVFGSVTIFIDHPFEVGDFIAFDSTEGIVEEIGLRSTRIRTLYNSLITMPNGKMADMRIDNLGKRVMRRYNTHYSLTYDTPTYLIEAYVNGLKTIHKNHPITNKDEYQIYLNRLNSSSIDILVNVFFDVDNWNDELEARSLFITQAIDLAKELNVRFAFPTQTLFIEDFPEKQDKTPIYDNDKKGVISKMNDYFGKKLDE